MSNLRKQIKWINKRGFVLFSLTAYVSVLLLTGAIVWAAQATSSNNSSSDPRLDNIGRVLTSFDTDSDDGAKALVIQLDGKIVAAGFSGINFQRRWMCNWWTCSN